MFWTRRARNKNRIYAPHFTTGQKWPSPHFWCLPESCTCTVRLRLRRRRILRRACKRISNWALADVLPVLVCYGVEKGLEFRARVDSQLPWGWFTGSFAKAPNLIGSFALQEQGEPAMAIWNIRWIIVIFSRWIVEILECPTNRKSKISRRTIVKFSRFRFKLYRELASSTYLAVDI